MGKSGVRYCSVKYVACFNYGQFAFVFRLVGGGLLFNSSICLSGLNPHIMDKNKTAIQTFIEGVLKGGWGAEFYQEQPNSYYEIDQINRDMWGIWFRWAERDSEKKLIEKSKEILLPSILLDPKSFEAYGKTAGWDTDAWFYNNMVEGMERGKEYIYQMHCMVDLLAEGRSLEQALQEII